MGQNAKMFKFSIWITLSMYIIVIGGGRIGEYLVSMLVEEGHNIALIEKDDEKARHMAENYDILVIKGDGSEAAYLEDAGIAKADVLVACTGNDQVNFVACQLAKNTYNVAKVIARTTNPSNKVLYESLGVDVVISTTEVAAKAMYAGIKGFTSVLTFSGEVELLHVRIEKTSPMVNRKLSEIHMPWGSIIATILRNGQIIVPRGEEMVMEGDELAIVAKKGVEKKIRELVLG